MFCHYQLFLIIFNSHRSVTSSAFEFGSSVITVSAECRRDVILKNPVKGENLQSDVSDGDALIQKLNIRPKYIHADITVIRALIKIG